MIYLFYLLQISLTTIGDTLSKYWSLSPRWLLMVLGVAAYVASSIVWMYTLRMSQHLAVSTVIVSVGYIISGLLLSQLLFKEQLSTLQITGIVLGIASVGLLLWEK